MYRLAQTFSRSSSFRIALQNQSLATKKMGCHYFTFGDLVAKSEPPNLQILAVTFPKLSHQMITESEPSVYREFYNEENFYKLLSPLYI